MADKKISQLTSLAPALSTDELPINRSNASGKLTVADVVAGEAATRASKDGDLTTLTTTANSDLVSAINEVNSGLSTKIPTSYLDTDTTLAANSDSKIATQKATKAYVLANVTPAATESIAGKAEIATQAETNTGTDDSRFITPLKLKTNLATYGYLTGSGTSRSLPLYSSGTVLGDSAIKQSATGTRILVNGITDDTATALQVSGSIRQTAVTTKLAAFDANGKLVDGGSGTFNYIPKFSTSGTILGNSLIRDDGTTLAIGDSPTYDRKFYIKNSDSYIGIFNSNNTLVSPFNEAPIYGMYNIVSSVNTLTANIGLYSYALNSTGANIAGIFQVPTGANNYAIKLIDGSQATGKVLQCADNNGNAKWTNHYIVNTYLVNTAFSDEPVTIDFNLGNYVVLDFSSAIVTVTSTNAVTFNNMKEGRVYKIKIIQGPSPAGQTYTPTFAGMKWPGGTSFTPTVGTGKIDFIDVWYDGTNYFGDFIKNYV